MKERLQEIQQTETNTDTVTRLRLLATAAKFSAILAVLGVSNTILTGDAVAHDHNDKAGENELKASTINVPALKKLLALAMSSGSMEEAIKKYGKKVGLNEAQIDTLKGLTREELKDLEMIQKKLDTFDDTQFKARRG
jgi:hypothetical protein